MKTTIKIREFSTMPALAMEGWDPNACDASDYDSPRAAALYKALGVDMKDEEYALARNGDGLLALIGLTTSGHKFAVEERAPETTRAKVVRISKSSRDKGSERAVFNGTFEECMAHAQGLSADVFNSIGIRYTNENGPQLRVIWT